MMKPTLLWALIVYHALLPSTGADNKNPCPAQKDCSSCLQAGDGKCSWCEDQMLQSDRAQCNVRRELAKFCKKISTEQSSNKVIKDIPFGDSVQVKPQMMSVILRPGEETAFTVSVQPAENYPVDLYYLMDLSSSMEDDLNNLRALGKGIAEKIQTVTKNYRLGFGSFVDKAVSPFISGNLTKDCPHCLPTFGFLHNMNFSHEPDKFEKAVRAQNISGNYDAPEGGFDALMQVAVCEEEFDWRPASSCRKIVVFVTDEVPHIAGDGKLGGIVIPNDGRCHMSDVSAEGTSRYTETVTQDYPSIYYLRKKMKEHSIVPIIATTGNVADVYGDITNAWKDLGATNGTLAGDSGNIVNLILESYQRIATTVRLVSDAPSGILFSAKATSTCRNGEGKDACLDVGIGHRVDFKVSVKLSVCSEEVKKMKSIKIAIAGFGDVLVNTKVLCECECKTEGAETNSSTCDGVGTLACGMCYCPSDRFGSDCKCDSQSDLDESRCYRNASDPLDVLCSGSGECSCGRCVCDQTGLDEGQEISGSFCECKNFGCPMHNNLECGGSARGSCQCGECKCTEDYVGENCANPNCTRAQHKCEIDGEMCSGKGGCDCGTCKCPGYSGKYCEVCESTDACAKKCSELKDCVLCQAFQMGALYDGGACGACALNISKRDEVVHKCAVQVENDCEVLFTFEQTSNSGEQIAVRSEKKCVIPYRTPIIFIVLGTMAAIVLAGLIALIVWKVLIVRHDAAEYQKWEDSKKAAKWQQDDNPLFKQAVQQFSNPAFNK